MTLSITDRVHCVEHHVGLIRSLKEIVCLQFSKRLIMLFHPMNEVSTQSHFRDFQLILGRQLDVSIEVVGEVL